MTMTSHHSRLCHLYIISAALSLASGFRGLCVDLSRKWNPSLQLRLERLVSSRRRRSSKLSALIYGWDGLAEEFDSGVTSKPVYSTFDLVDNTDDCTPEGTFLAQALSYDTERAGHLARLAVAFSPPERALRLEQLEHVDVICVRNDAVDIQAVICEDGTCITLSVPVKFPRSCTNEENWDSKNTCVLRNIDDLDAQAGSVLSQRQDHGDNLNDDNDWGEWDINNLPPWWITPYPGSSLALDCENVRQVLNDAEFQPDVKALAHDTLRSSSMTDSHDYNIVQARIALVGPAGLLFHVRARSGYADKMVRLEAAYSFGRNPMNDVESLRAAVLGALASAEGN